VRRIAADIGIGAAAFVTLHELGRRWGATLEEARRPMPGDDVVARPKGQTTHAITIYAARQDVWPWIVQMGYQASVPSGSPRVSSCRRITSCWRTRSIMRPIGAMR
jgi:hypothetical protein